MFQSPVSPGFEVGNKLPGIKNMLQPGLQTHLVIVCSWHSWLTVRVWVGVQSIERRTLRFNCCLLFLIVTV